MFAFASALASPTISENLAPCIAILDSGYRGVSTLHCACLERAVALVVVVLQFGKLGNSVRRSRRLWAWSTFRHWEHELITRCHSYTHTLRYPPEWGGGRV